MSLKKRMEEEIFSPFRKRDEFLIPATVLNAYNEHTNGQHNSTIYLDVGVVNSSGELEGTMERVPLLKMGGFSQSLPPVGSTAIIGKISSDNEGAICLGWYDSEITKRYMQDDIAPKEPPSFITK